MWTFSAINVSWPSLLVTGVRVHCLVSDVLVGVFVVRMLSSMRMVEMSAATASW